MKADPKKLDRNLFHEYLWKKADSKGKITVSQQHLADELFVHRVTMARVMHELELQGRIVKLGESRHRHSVYKIVDPETYRWNVRSRNL